ncbi:unnamed protein product [Nyctereutes procyonoides]|uniref:(raccoon dog) hypothetical protein n=1 Tax=Nyctereutes procyonoides TaxID=34880 RepID=A0A811XTR5_NYCPR|nr:unnamed protein product [Nyctereutes procyonoides]
MECWLRSPEMYGRGPFWSLRRETILYLPIPPVNHFLLIYQSYEIRLLENRKLGDFQDLNTKYVKSIIQVVFHDRRLQYTEHQRLEGWQRSRPGHRILDIDIPPSVGILDPRASPTQLNAVEFLWDPSKRATAFIQVHCISTEFTPRKHGGTGVPFRVQIDTFKQNENGEYTEHWHSASCQIKVFKRKGANRKQKTDWEKMEKRTVQEKEKYQPSYETTILTECSPWPDMAYQVNSAPSPSYNDSPNSFGLGEGNSSPTHPVETLPLSNDHLLPSASIQDAQQWLHRNRFSQFCQLFTSFSGEHLCVVFQTHRDLKNMVPQKFDCVQLCWAGPGVQDTNRRWNICTHIHIHKRRVAPQPCLDIFCVQILKVSQLPILQQSDFIRLKGCPCPHPGSLGWRTQPPTQIHVTDHGPTRFRTSSLRNYGKINLWCFMLSQHVLGTQQVLKCDFLFFILLFSATIIGFAKLRHTLALKGRQSGAYHTTQEKLL